GQPPALRHRGEHLVRLGAERDRAPDGLHPHPQRRAFLLRNLAEQALGRIQPAVDLGRVQRPGDDQVQHPLQLVHPAPPPPAGPPPPRAARGRPALRPPTPGPPRSRPAPAGPHEASPSGRGLTSWVSVHTASLSHPVSVNDCSSLQSTSAPAPSSAPTASSAF